MSSAVKASSLDLAFMFGGGGYLLQSNAVEVLANTLHGLFIALSLRQPTNRRFNVRFLDVEIVLALQVGRNRTPLKLV